MNADLVSDLLADYFAGRAPLASVAAALAELHRAEGWGLYLALDTTPPEHAARAEALLARYTELTAQG